MYRDPALYQQFLEELQALRAFRERYLALHPWAPIETDDPDIRHLVEALAFFSARSRRSAEGSLQGFYRRLFAQYFPFLLHPMPAAGLLEATPTGQMVDPTLLPADSEVRLQAEGGESAIFRTTADLPLQPLRLERVDTAAAPGGGLYLRLHLRAKAAVDSVHLFVHHLGEYWSSARMMDALNRHLVGARSGVSLGPRSEGEPAAVTLGERRVPGEPARATGQHPLEALRMRLHAPEIEHFVNVKLNAPTRGLFQLGLEMDDRWVPDPYLGRRSFRLFAVPVVNLNPAPAAPIRFEGARTRTRIRPIELGPALRAVRGVYRTTERGLTPLRSGAIPGPGGSYELEPGGWVRLQIPGALEDPVVVSVEGDWYDPGFSRHADSPLAAAPFRRKIDGARWAVVGPLRPHALPEPGDEVLFFLQALSLRTKPQMDREELVVLLRMLGGLDQGPYGELVEALEQVEVTPVVRADAAAPELQHRYTLRFAGLEMDRLYQLRVFARHVEALLDAWLSRGQAHVEVELTPGEEAAP